MSTRKALSPTLLGRVLAQFAVLGLLLSASPSSFADRNAVSMTFNFKDLVETFPADLCGEPYIVTNMVNRVSHITDNLSTPNPVDHFTFTDAGTVTLVPANDPTLPTYNGRVTFWAGGNTNPNSDGFTLTLNLDLTGSDGSTVRVHETSHVTVANGVLVVMFDNLRCSQS